MKAKATGKNKMDTVFVLILFSVFALSVLMVLMLGAKVYKNMTDITREGQDERTILAYIWTRVKNGDKEGNVNVGEFCGINALCFDEEYDGTLYRTVIYHYDGWVYELFAEAGIDFWPIDGVRVMKSGSLSFEEAGYGLIKVSAGSISLLLSPRSGSGNSGGVGPGFGGEGAET